MKDIAGHWWLPESSAIRVAGTLTRGADDRASLVLRGTLSESAGDVSNRTVLGLSDAAVPITIETDFETNRAHSSTRRGGNVIRQTVGVRRAFVGVHLATEEERRFKRVSFSLSDLDEWTGWAGPTEDWNQDGLSIRYEPPEAIDVSLPWGSLRLAASYGVDGERPTERRIHVSAGFVATRDVAVGVDVWLDEVVAPVRDFVSIATDRPNQVIDLAVESHPREPFTEVIYSPTTIEVPGQPAFWPDLPTTVTGLGPGYPDVLARWFELSDRIGAALDLYLSTQYRRSTNLENRFLNTVAAAEAYHRRVSPVTPEDIARHVARVDRIAASTTSRRDRDWLRWKLKYAFEPSFADRLFQLAMRADQILGPWVGDARAFATRVSDARNLLVHQDPEATSPPSSGMQLVDMTEDVAIVLLVCLYEDLGFDLLRIRDGLGRTRRWRFLEFRKREWSRP